MRIGLVANAPVAVNNLLRSAGPPEVADNELEIRDRPAEVLLTAGFMRLDQHQPCWFDLMCQEPQPARHAVFHSGLYETRIILRAERTKGKWPSIFSKSKVSKKRDATIPTTYTAA